MEEIFLEDTLEKTRYAIKSESDNIQGCSRRRRRQQESKIDPITEKFEALFILSCLFSHSSEDVTCISIFVLVFMTDIKLIWYCRKLTSVLYTKATVQVLDSHLKLGLVQR